MKTFLFIRGLPASGKITVARKLEDTFGWNVIWLYDIKNAIYGIVKSHALSELMRQVLAPITTYMLEQKKDIIYVRPAVDNKSVEQMHELVKQYPDYQFFLVTLTADRDELIRRAKGREDPYRIKDEKGFDDYVNRNPPLSKFMDEELVIDTTHISPDEVTEIICKHFSFNT